MSEVSSTLLKVQLSEYIPEVGPVVPDADGGKGSAPGSGNQGFNTILKADADHSAANATIQAVPIAFFGLAFFILTFIILSIIKKRKNPYLIEGKSAKYTKLQVFSAASASILLAIVFNSAIFSTPYVGPVETTVSEELTIDADILGTDQIRWIEDSIIVPASEYGYELYVSTDDTDDNRLIADSTEGYISSISTPGALADNTYGFSFEDPSTNPNAFQPVQLKHSGKTSVRTITPEESTEPISIWYGVRSKNAEEDVYRTNIEYEVIGRQDLRLEDITPEICASLQEGIADYEFINSLGETQFVSKLKDGNCWTQPVQTEDPEDPGTQPALACPTNWHEAKDNDYTELDIFYDVKNPETTANPIIVGYDKTTEHPEGGCVADFTEATFTFDFNDGPDGIEMPSSFTETATNFETTVALPDIPDHPMKVHFRGWSLTPDGTAPLYTPLTQQVTFTSPNVKLYAIWDTKTPKAILDTDGLLNFVYDYYTIEDVNNPETGYKAAYEAKHNTEITDVYLVRGDATTTSHIPWFRSSPGNTDIIKANFEPSFKDYKPQSTRYWFYYLTNLEEILNLENLNTSEITDMSYMFKNAISLTSLNLPEGFGSQATNMGSMFYGLPSLTSLNLPEGFGSQATNMYDMFNSWYAANMSACNSPQITSLNLPEGFGSQATNMRGMFYCFQNLESINLPAGFGSQATIMREMFTLVNNIKSINLPAGFGSQARNMEGMFDRTHKLTSINLPAGFGSQATNMSKMFNNAISLTSLNLPEGFGSQATDMSYMFVGVHAITSLDFPEGFGSQATDMSYMFSSARALTSLDFPEGFGSQATDMSYMFQRTSALTSLDFPEGFGSQATDMSHMFSTTGALTSLNLPEGFGSQATDMSYMFVDTNALVSPDFPEGFGSQATNMSHMFAGAKALVSLDFPEDFGSQAMNMNGMFRSARTLASLDFPDGFGGNVTDTELMFNNAEKLEYIYVSDGTDWNTENVTSHTEMFRYAAKLPGYKSYNANDITNAHINGEGDTVGYFTRACMKDNSCPDTSSGQSNTNSNSPLSTNNTPDTQEPDQEPAAQPQTPSSTPEGPAPLGVITASKIDNSAAILFAIAMACLFSGTTMLILIIEKVKRDYREENDQF